MKTDGPEKIVLLKEQEQHHKMAEMAYIICNKEIRQSK